MTKSQAESIVALIIIGLFLWGFDAITREKHRGYVDYSTDNITTGYE